MNIKKTEVEFLAGTEISKAMTEAYYYSLNNKTDVTFTFNGQRITIEYQGETK